MSAIHQVHRLYNGFRRRLIALMKLVRRDYDVVDRVRQLQQEVEQLIATVGRQDEMLVKLHHEYLQADITNLDSRMQAHVSAVAELGQRVGHQELIIRHVISQADLLKSHLETGQTRFHEFQAWRETAYIPDSPLVSVCVATYNRCDLLVNRCLRSILDQTYQNLEVVVVGDHCSDNTPMVLGNFDDPRVRFVNLEQRGNYPKEPHRRWMVAGSVAMNRGLELAQGDYVTHLDDDDEFLPDRIERLVEFARQEQADFVFHPFWYEEPNGTWTLINAEDLRLGQVTTSAIFYRSWLKQIHWNPESHLLEEPGDWNRFRRIKYLGARCIRYPEPLTRHFREMNQKRKAA